MILNILCATCLIWQASGMASGRDEAHELYVSVTEYFPEIRSELTRVTWAHAVNSQARLDAALQDTRIMMLEADILMGHHPSLEEATPIMAHPPANTSDLTFVEFLDTVINATTSSGVRKGIKLDFKDMESVEACLKILKTRLKLASVKVPVFINADILKGPVNATKLPMDGDKFVSLAKKHTPFAVLSVGWTTRYGEDDPSDEIRDGKYEDVHWKEMKKFINNNAGFKRGDSPVFPHVTFPVRAGLAANSDGELLKLISHISGRPSLTLWSSNTDPVNRRKLQTFVNIIGKGRIFLDLPFDINEEVEEEDLAGEEEEDPESLHIQGRGHEEEHTQSNGAAKAIGALGVIGILGVVTSLLYLYARK